jgi:hypothetical protein
VNTLGFLRDLADALGCDVAQLDDSVTQYILDHVQLSNVELCARVYREYTEDQVNP